MNGITLSLGLENLRCSVMRPSYDTTLRFKECGYKEEDVFMATCDHSHVKVGDVLILKIDDGISCPYYFKVFVKADGYKERIEMSCCYAVSWTKKINTD